LNEFSGEKLIQFVKTGSGRNTKERFEGRKGLKKGGCFAHRPPSPPPPNAEPSMRPFGTQQKKKTPASTPITAHIAESLLTDDVSAM
jgi:hypothetical protein